MPHIVAVEDECSASLPVQLLFNRMCDRRFAGAGQAGKPQADASVAVHLLPSFTGHSRAVPDDIIAVFQIVSPGK